MTQEELKNISTALNNGIAEMGTSSESQNLSITGEDYKDPIRPPRAIFNNILKGIVLQIKLPSFEKDKKWEVLMGGDALPVSIEDENFMKKVLSGEEQFHSGDVLVADLLMSQRVETDRTVVSYSIERVTQHGRSLEQLVLPI